MENIFSFI